MAAFSSQAVPAQHPAIPTSKSITDFTDKDRIALPTVKISVQAMMLQMAAAKQWGSAISPGSIRHGGHVAAGRDDCAVERFHRDHQCLQRAAVPVPAAREARIRTVLNSTDVFGGTHTFTVAWTSTQFRDKNPPLQGAGRRLHEATEMLNKDVKEAAQLWIDNVKSKLTVEKVAEIAAGKQVKWTMVPENT
jgi:NitT/TauT family transport system substrate-binding protein